jgi:AbrB family looped-hinge helix DNA binding protein
MRITIDGAGRVVIPKPMRDDLGLRGGDELEVVARDGRIELEPAQRRMILTERDGFLAAEVDDEETPTLTTDEVREALERLRR